MLRSAPWYCLISHHLESKCCVWKGDGEEAGVCSWTRWNSALVPVPISHEQTDRQTPAQLITSLCQLTSGRQTLDSTVKIRLEKGRLIYIFSRTFTFWKFYKVNSVSHLITPWIKVFPNKFLFTSRLRERRVCWHTPCLAGYTPFGSEPLI